MSLSLNDVQKIARLARLSLNEVELHETLDQLNGIFSVIESLQSVDTEGIEPLTTPLAAVTEVALRLREDAVTESDRRDDFQACAPATEAGLYLVPRVIE